MHLGQCSRVPVVCKEHRTQGCWLLCVSPPGPISGAYVPESSLTLLKPSSTLPALVGASYLALPTPFLSPSPSSFLLFGSLADVIDKISKSIHVTFIVQVSINPPLSRVHLNELVS